MRPAVGDTGFRHLRDSPAWIEMERGLAHLRQIPEEATSGSGGSHAGIA
jgi:hypothetical protein